MPARTWSPAASTVSVAGRSSPGPILRDPAAGHGDVGDDEALRVPRGSRRDEEVARVAHGSPRKAMRVRKSTTMRSATSRSPGLTCSSGWWLRPSLQRTKSMATGASDETMTASWPGAARKGHRPALAGPRRCGKGAPSGLAEHVTARVVLGHLDGKPQPAPRGDRPRGGLKLGHAPPFGSGSRDASRRARAPHRPRSRSSRPDERRSNPRSRQAAAATAQAPQPPG